MLIAVLSDIHGNYDALQKVSPLLTEAEEIVVLGDTVGYGAEPDDCVHWVREKAALCLMGNHDAACVDELPLTWFNPTAAEAVEWTRKNLSPASYRYLQELPQGMEHRHGASWVHGSPAEPLVEYITHASIALGIFDRFDFSVCFFGHTHVAEVYEYQDGMVHTHSFAGGGTITLDPQRRYLVNPGSIGQPRDGNPQASLALYNSDEGTVHVKRVKYDFRKAGEKILSAGLPEMLALRLLAGN